MGTQPVGKLMISMSLPIMISMLVQALYNIVDSIFVAKISEDALTAVSLAFPIQTLMIAVGAGTGVGINALLSKSLGEKNFEKANRAANNGIFLAFFSFLLFVVIGLCFTGLFYNVQTKNADIRQYGKDYLYVVTVASLGLFMQMTFEKLLQSTGKTIYSMFTQGLGAIVNLILDPCLIFGWGPFPKMGVAGAALATVIGQCLAALLGLLLNIKVNKEIKISLKKYPPNRKTIKHIYAVGLPSIIMQSIGSVMTYSLNKILIGYSETAVAVLGVYFKLQSFIFMPIFGLNNGYIPIVAYNYGARKKARIIKAFKCGAVCAVSIMAVGTLLFLTIPDKLLGFFDAGDEMLRIGVPALRIISTHFVIASFSIMMISTLQ
ncbi:MAG: MATE family efflux transporter, partial [Ruminococcus sp.]|nr:MATE family efflux transporter [Ruminococcus sp.]